MIRNRWASLYYLENMHYYVGAPLDWQVPVITLITDHSRIDGSIQFPFQLWKGRSSLRGILPGFLSQLTTMIIRIFAKFLKNTPLNFNQNHFYVNYGNEQTGILYGEIWLGSQVGFSQSEGHIRASRPIRSPLLFINHVQAFIAQSCGENCAMWCDVDERKMWSAYT